MAGIIDGELVELTHKLRNHPQATASPARIFIYQDLKANQDLSPASAPIAAALATA